MYVLLVFLTIFIYHMRFAQTSNAKHDNMSRARLRKLVCCRFSTTPLDDIPFSTWRYHAIKQVQAKLFNPAKMHNKLQQYHTQHWKQQLGTCAKVIYKM